MEVFRASLAESVVLELFNSRQLREEHFERDGKVRRIGRQGYGAVVRGHEERAGNRVALPSGGGRASWRAVLQDQAAAVAAHVEDKRPFEPYIMGT